jgi:acetylornithine deacetylase
MLEIHYPSFSVLISVLYNSARLIVRIGFCLCIYYVEEREPILDDITILLHQLVSINSINPDLVPGAPGEGEIARFVASWLQQAGLEVTIDEAQPGRSNVVGIARGTGGGRSLMLNAHMDTVGVVGMRDPHSPYIENNRLYGRAAFDMKAGLAAIMYAGAAAQQQNLRGDVIVTAVVDEEYASIGTQSILKRWRADAAIVTEPTDLDLCVAHKGFIWQEITTYGRAAHGSLPDEGIDAIVKTGHVLVSLEALNQALSTSPPHPLLGHGSLHASLISGGQELSSYPERCVLSVERRTIPGETTEQVETQVRAILDRLHAADSTFKATVQTTLVRDPFSASTSEPIVQILQNHAQKLLNREMGVGGSFGWMDSALLDGAGIPTVIFGPGGAGAHAAVEWANLDQLHLCSDILLATIMEFCG